MNSIKGFTIWFTGLPGSGKSTNSYNLYIELKRRGLKAELLDGDIIRTNFSQELGYTKRERDINVRRIGFVSYLLNKNNIISVVAAIAPYRETREINRKLLGNYIEVFCNCPLEILEKRDPKGLYRKARSGEIKNFSGISDPYEIPEEPEITLNTHIETPEESFNKVISYLENHGFIPKREDCEIKEYSDEEEMENRKHLIALGFAHKLADI